MCILSVIVERLARHFRPGRPRSPRGEPDENDNAGTGKTPTPGTSSSTSDARPEDGYYYRRNGLSRGGAAYHMPEPSIYDPGIRMLPRRTSRSGAAMTNPATRSARTITREPAESAGGTA
jgi:hypothetical protein